MTGPKTRRSLVFVWHTGEERGLWGSRYYADYPSVPIDKIVAQLNMDMVGRNDKNDQPKEANTVYLVGSDRISTELHNLNEDANASLKPPMKIDYAANDPGGSRADLLPLRPLQLRGQGRSHHLLHDRPPSRLSREHRQRREDRLQQDGADQRAHVRDGTPGGESRSRPGA